MIQRLAIHKVGNPTNEENILLSKKEVAIDVEVRELLEQYFTKSFQFHEFYQFTHSSNLELNECYHFVQKIFEEPSTIMEQSQNLAHHLYENSTHPKIKAGEFYVVYFNTTNLIGEMVDAVGLFKSENKEHFLKVYPQGEAFDVDSEEGININKLDKGCIIFNTDEENGYVLSVVDKTNKSSEAALFWIDHFLNAQPREDQYYQTSNTLEMYKTFVEKQLPEEFENLSRLDQADLKNRTMNYFQENSSFDLEVFEDQVLVEPDLIDSFTDYKNTYANERDLQIAETFDISDKAVRKQQRHYKSVIKLDKNFHIYVHGDRSKILQSEDEDGRFYKLYFTDEH